MKLCPKCQKQFSDDANFCPVDAARLIPVEGQGAGGDTLSQRFELKDRLGGSRTGAVHRARDKQGGATVAVKLVAPSVVALPGVAQRLERELKQLERVQSAGVAKVLGSGKRGEETWLAVELIDGAQTLAEAISARGPISLDFAAHLIEVVGEALIEAAQVGVVHRDLAPKNILFAGDEIKLINFSLPVPTTDKTPGVPEFVAPEQVEGKPVDQRSNLYSLGALYYYVLTGQTVHAGSADEVHHAHVNGSIKTPSSLAPVPAPVEAVIMRALDRSPTKRFLTVRQFVDEVGRVAKSGANPASTMPMGKAGGRPKAELVQTLLGVRQMPGMATPPPGAVVLPPSAQVPTAPLTAPSGAATVQGVPALAPVVAQAAMQSGPPLMPEPAPTPTTTPTPAPAPASVVVATPAPSADRSPWAAPGAMAGAEAAVAQAAPAVGAVAAAVAAPVSEPAPAPTPAVAAPVFANPAPAAPVVATPSPGASQAQGKKKPVEQQGSKGKFRETMWFKKGDLDAQAAVAAAEERERTGKDAVKDKADSMPIDQRYEDDGSISRGDKEKYSLRTGATQMMTAIKEDPKASGSIAKVSEDALIGEMKGGRGPIFIALAVGLIVVGVIVFMLAS
ncbi:MAG: serine/threonine-protein kinase [Kofleriaceae bacterium]|nr:serine/threonine-protein kinase [Kofleriaceae bacterium]